MSEEERLRQAREAVAAVMTEPVRVIWRYELPTPGNFSLEMPVNPAFLGVQTQKGIPVLWAMVNPEAPKRWFDYPSVGGRPGVTSCRWIGVPRDSADAWRGVSLASVSDHITEQYRNLKGDIVE